MDLSSLKVGDMFISVDEDWNNTYPKGPYIVTDICNDGDEHEVIYYETIEPCINIAINGNIVFGIFRDRWSRKMLSLYVKPYTSITVDESKMDKFL